MAQFLKPVCSSNHVVKNDFLKGILAMPARRTLEIEKIDSLEKLSNYSEEELMQFHGFGKNTITKLKTYMKENNQSFKTNFQ